jgi:hypothetical protein
MERLIDKHFTITVISILCIVEMVITGQGPSTGWLFIAYGCYKVVIKDMED